jgi:hypothetical protein
LLNAIEHSESSYDYAPYYTAFPQCCNMRISKQAGQRGRKSTKQKSKCLTHKDIHARIVSFPAVPVSIDGSIQILHRGTAVRLGSPVLRDSTAVLLYFYGKRTLSLWDSVLTTRELTWRRPFLLSFHVQRGLLMGLLGLTRDASYVYVVHSPPVSVWLSMWHFPRF